MPKSALAIVRTEVEGGAAGGNRPPRPPKPNAGPPATFPALQVIALRTIVDGTFDPDAWVAEEQIIELVLRSECLTLPDHRGRRPLQAAPEPGDDALVPVPHTRDSVKRGLLQLTKIQSLKKPLAEGRRTENGIWMYRLTRDGLGMLRGLLMMTALARAGIAERQKAVEE